MLRWVEFFCADIKRSVSSPLPGDIPWYDPSHTVFFTALYGALGVICLGVLAAIVLTVMRMGKNDSEGHH